MLVSILLETNSTTKKGSITSVQATCVPVDDLIDLALATIFVHLDAMTMLTRQIFELGICPAANPLDFTFHMLPPVF